MTRFLRLGPVGEEIPAVQTDAGTFDLSATVRLEVTWTSNAPFGGTLPAIARTSSIDVEVGEIQAIGTRGGG